MGGGPISMKQALRNTVAYPGGSGCPETPLAMIFLNLP